MTDIRPGIYEHFKGGEYQVVSVAKHTETGEDLVVYRSTGSDSQWWVRPREMFEESVKHRGELKPRFTYVGQSW